MAEEPAAARRRGVGAIVLAGLATSGLTAVAAAKPWFRADVAVGVVPGVPDSAREADMPLALALSLVVLAGWGALLVTRGRLRRVVAGVALLASAGVVACVVAAPFTLPDQVRGGLPEGTTASASATGWYVAAAIASVLSLVVLVLAWVRVPQWPTMSSRYDAPSARSTPPAETDLWKALDEGRDPTDPAGPPSP